MCPPVMYRTLVYHCVSCVGINLATLVFQGEWFVHYITMTPSVFFHYAETPDFLRHFIQVFTLSQSTLLRSNSLFTWIYQAFSQERNRKIISYFPTKTWCGYLKEPSQCDGSFEHSKHMGEIILIFLC